MAFSTALEEGPNGLPAVPRVNPVPMGIKYFCAWQVLTP